MDIVSAILQAVILFLGGLITVATALVVENARRPKLKLKLARHTDLHFGQGSPAISARWVNLGLVNLPPSGWTRCVPRQIAIQCHGSVVFYYLNGQRVFDKDMPIRWANSPQPIPSELRDPSNQVIGFIYDHNRLLLESRIDVPPGEEGEALSVAGRFDADIESYGWSNESYSSIPRWRNPDRKLPEGTYLVKVTVFSAGEKCTDVFRLINEGPVATFRLERPQEDDKGRIAAKDNV